MSVSIRAQYKQMSFIKELIPFFNHQANITIWKNHFTREVRKVIGKRENFCQIICQQYSVNCSTLKNPCIRIPIRFTVTSGLHLIVRQLRHAIRFDNKLYLTGSYTISSKKNVLRLT